MGLKRVSSYEHFKMFDKDKDGLIKQHDFESVLGRMNIASKEEAGEIFQKFKKDHKTKFLDY
jgi:Ca2+-binding EF-hand superfamily protein